MGTSRGSWKPTEGEAELVDEPEVIRESLNQSLLVIEAAEDVQMTGTAARTSPGSTPGGLQTGPGAQFKVARE